MNTIKSEIWIYNKNKIEIEADNADYIFVLVQLSRLLRSSTLKASFPAVF